MGLAKFLIKHGIGSPGSIAKRQARHYKSLKREHPELGEREILGMMYMARAQVGHTTGATAWHQGFFADDPASVDEFLKEPGLTVRDFIMRVIVAEDRNYFTAPERVHELIEEVVEEVLDKELPGWKAETTLTHPMDSETALTSLDSDVGGFQGNQQYKIGATYYHGEGIPQDYAEAAVWFRRASENEHAEAQYALGLMSHDGKGMPRDPAEAASWYRKASKHGHAGAQCALGGMHQFGVGMAQDAAEAAKWYQLAAEQGKVEAQLSLGFAHRSGFGVPQCDYKAAKWFREAAKGGDARAQHFLSSAYCEGIGVSLDYSEAARWSKLAAWQGHVKAQSNLGTMYAEGKGVPQDYVQAYIWLNLAASKRRGEGFEQVARLREQLVEQMTPDQIAEAQRVAREWKPKTWDELKKGLEATASVTESTTGDEEKDSADVRDNAAIQTQMAEADEREGNCSMDVRAELVELDFTENALELIQEGRADEALAVLTEAIGGMPSDWTPVRQQGKDEIVYCWDEDEFSAYSDYRRHELPESGLLVWERGSYSEACCMVGSLHIDRQDYPKALRFFNLGLELEPDHPVLMSEKAYVYQAQHDYQQALDLFRRAEQSRPWITNRQKARALRGQGFCLVELNRTDEAQQVLKHAQQADPEDTKAAQELEFIRTLRLKRSQ